MNQSKSQLFIFSALECEARPLINYYELKKDVSNHIFSMYKNEHIVLTISGVGKVAIAGAVAYSLSKYMNNQLPVLINIGIAGHQTEEIGTLCLADKSVDIDSGKKFYPQLIGNNWPKTSEIKTYSRPDLDYNSDCLCDMEASAFYETAIRFSAIELIHCIKIVSDNQTSSIEKIQTKQVMEWIGNHLTEIDGILKRLLKLRNSISSIDLQQYDDIEKQWHFTVNGKIRLRALLIRWELLSNDVWLGKEQQSYTSSKEVLRKLEADVARLRVIL